MITTNTLAYYLEKVQRKAALRVSPSFPTVNPNEEESLVLDSINETLRYLNNKHYLAFKQTEYTLTTTAGVNSYDLTQAPYNQRFWRIHRLALNGVRRAEDDMVLDFLDYTRLDHLRPANTAQALPSYYSAYASNLLIWPPPTGSQLKIRYYGTHIGTDTTGTEFKMRLDTSTDVTMLDDQFEDVLIYGAAATARGAVKVDDRHAELSKKWEQWENILIDMANQPGEDANPALKIRPFIPFESIDMTRFYPFGTTDE